MGVAELRRLRQLEDENRKLKQLVADLSLDQHMLQDVLKKVVTPVPKRSMVQYLRSTYKISGRRACNVVALAHSTYHYRSVAPAHIGLRQRLRDLALSRIGWGYRRLTTVLQREGWSVGRKLVYRL